MNRIRKTDSGYQVLITPNMKIAPDLPVLIGNWEDSDLRNFYVLTYPTLNDAQAEAFKYPDIDWFRLILNHKYIYERLDLKIREIIKSNNFDVEYKSHLMDAKEFKNKMFDRVIRNGERFNLRYNFNDIITFTIVSPWSTTLHRISQVLETYRDHLYSDVLRIRYKKIVDGKTIVLDGITEFGTIYEIRLVPALLERWSDWMKKTGKNEEQGMVVYKNMLKQQNDIDKGMTLN
jgi:hypothetical protein